MVRRSAETRVHVREHAFEGKGSITVRDLLRGPEEMYEKGRVFAHTTLQPGCSIGYHVHENESDTYYILSGTAAFDDNGEKTTVHAGDVTFTPCGQGHGIENCGDEPLELIALILYR